MGELLKKIEYALRKDSLSDAERIASARQLVSQGLNDHAPTAMQPACKTIYVKPLRTLVAVDERYADRIRDLLNTSDVNNDGADAADVAEVLYQRTGGATEGLRQCYAALLENESARAKQAQSDYDKAAAEIVEWVADLAKPWLEWRGHKAAIAGIIAKHVVAPRSTATSAPVAWQYRENGSLWGECSSAIVNRVRQEIDDGSRPGGELRALGVIATPTPSDAMTATPIISFEVTPELAAEINEKTAHLPPIERLRAALRLATPAQPGDVREKAARIIDGASFNQVYVDMYPDRSTIEQFTAYEKADAILALSAPVSPSTKTPDALREALKELSDAWAHDWSQADRAGVIENVERIAHRGLKALSAPSAAVTDEWREAWGDLHSHRSAWRNALVKQQTPFGSDDDGSYWDHELKAFDRVFAVLLARNDRLPPQPITPKPKCICDWDRPDTSMHALDCPCHKGEKS